MTKLRLVRLCVCLTLIILPALALGGPSGQSGAAAPQNIDCVYLPMVSAGGQAAANITVAQAASPCGGLAAAPEPSPTGGGIATATATDTSTATATATDTATSTATNTATHTATATPSLTPSPSSTSGPVGSIAGSVAIWPEYEYNPPPLRIPLQIVIVLDVSGSMNANASGQCNNTGAIVQCAAGPEGSPPVTAEAGEDAWWNPTEERRIYTVKKAAARLIDLLNMAGNASYDPASPSDEVAIVWFNERQSTSMTFNWSSTAIALKQAVQNAGATNGDIYRTSGGSNGAAGLYRASLMLKSRTSFAIYGGKRFDYQRKLLFISDGMANHFLDTSKANLNGGPSSAETYASANACKALGAAVLENVSCQTTDVGGTHVSKGWDRPITQMVATSRTNIQSDPQTNAQAYVLSPANIVGTGLKDGVASFPSYFFPITSYQTLPNGSSNVDLIAEGWISYTYSSCEPRADSEWRDTFPPESAGNVAGLTYPVIGEAVASRFDVSYRSDIRVDASGRARYSFTDLSPGTYTLSTYVFYRHPLDPPAIMPRRYSWIEIAGETTSVIAVEVSAGAPTQAPVRLKLSGNTCAGQ